MPKLVKMWTAISYGNPETRSQFIEKHVAPLLLRAKRTRRDQPARKSGHDTVAVSRDVFITKQFKTVAKYRATKASLQLTKNCYCTPALVGYNGETKVVVEEDVGNTLRELGSMFSRHQKTSIVEHFQQEHGMRIHLCQVSAQNVCRRRDGRLCLVDTAKWVKAK